MERRYVRMAEAASNLNLEQLDLLSYGIEGEIPIGVIAYGEISLCPRSDTAMSVDVDEKGNAIKGGTPDWIVMLMPKTLRAIAQDGKALSGRGYRWLEDRWEPLNIDSKSGITLGDLIVPVGALKQLSQRHEQLVTQPETPVSPKGKETFQRQIAGLALVIHQLSKNAKGWGEKPNKKQIAEAVMKTIDDLPKELMMTLNIQGLGFGTIRQNIAKGFQLIGFTENK